jgi:hypothetical protein
MPLWLAVIVLAVALSSLALLVLVFLCRRARNVDQLRDLHAILTRSGRRDGSSATDNEKRGLFFRWNSKPRSATREARRWDSGRSAREPLANARPSSGGGSRQEELVVHEAGTTAVALAAVRTTSAASASEQPPDMLRAAIADMDVDDTTLVLHDLLAQGGFGSVYRGVWRNMEARTPGACSLLAGRPGSLPPRRAHLLADSAVKKQG